MLQLHETVLVPHLMDLGRSHRRSAHRWGRLAATMLAVTGAIFWRGKHPVYPEGSARYREALKEVKTAFQHAGVHL